MMLSSRAVAIAGPPPSKDVVDQFLDCVEDQGWDTKACLTSYGYDLSTFTCDSKAVCQDLVRCGYFDEDTWLGCLTVPMDPCLEKCDETLSIQQIEDKTSNNLTRRIDQADALLTRLYGVVEMKLQLLNKDLN